MKKYRLKHPEWQRKRLEIFNRDGFKCIICNSDEKEPHIHHFKYSPNTDPWDYDDSNFITYCHQCHEIEENCKNDFNKLISAGFTYSKVIGIISLYSSKKKPAEQIKKILNHQKFHKLKI